MRAPGGELWIEFAKGSVGGLEAVSNDGLDGLVTIRIVLLFRWKTSFERSTLITAVDHREDSTWASAILRCAPVKGYVAWCNTEHYHAGFDYVTPQQAQNGLRQIMSINNVSTSLCGDAGAKKKIENRNALQKEQPNTKQ